MFDKEYLDGLDERMEIARRLLRVRDAEALLNEASRLDNFNVNLLYGYVRSFVRLAYLGDVREAALQLGTTRQSIKRHVLELENLLEAQLFETIGATSRLTNMGALWLPRAQEFFELAGAFLNRKGSNQAQYRSTQLPLRMLLRDPSNSELLRSFALSWMQDGQSTRSRCYSSYKDHCILYERVAGSWQSREIGKNSAFSKRFGPNITKKSEKKKLSEMQTGSDLHDEISLLLDGVYTRGGLHFSEVACNLYNSAGTQREPVLYQRLLAELTDQDDRPVVASIIQLIDPLQTNQEHD